jgi:hypothetical protein
MNNYQQKIQRLGIYEEVVGVLYELNGNETFLIARIGNLDIVLPPEMESELCPIIGTHIGILHTDIPGKEYLVRSMPSCVATYSSAANEEAQSCQGGA